MNTTRDESTVAEPDGYTHYPTEKARLLWMVGYGMQEVDGVLDLKKSTLLQCPGRRGGELTVCFGMPCLTMGMALNSLGVRYREWISVGSLVLIFPSDVIGELLAKLVELFGERQPMYRIKCDRASTATALRDYRRRRDSLLLEDKT